MRLFFSRQSSRESPSKESRERANERERKEKDGAKERAFLLLGVSEVFVSAIEQEKKRARSLLLSRQIHLFLFFFLSPSLALPLFQKWLPRTTRPLASAMSRQQTEATPPTASRTPRR